MIKAVFFDLYGTLAGFQPSRFSIQAAACAEAGIELTEDGVRRGYAAADAYMAEQNAINPLRQRDREGYRAFFSEYERLVLKGSNVDVAPEQAWEIWSRIRQMPYKMTRFDDVLPTLEVLRDRGLTLGLISNMNRDAADLTEAMGLSKHMDFAVTSSEVGAEKPHPLIFLAALEKAGCAPGESVHVGDQPTSDVAGAQGVGIRPVLLDRDGNHRATPDCPRIESMPELPPLLEGM